MNTITRTQARSHALKLSGEGVPQHEIGKRLADLGYLGPKTKRPMTQGEVSRLIRAGHFKKSKKKASRKAKNAPTKAEKTTPHVASGHQATLDVIKLIIQNTDISVSQRLEFIKGIIR